MLLKELVRCIIYCPSIIIDASFMGEEMMATQKTFAGRQLQ